MYQEQLEQYYSLGYVPDRYYYQLNKKSASDNYREQKNKRFTIKKGKFTMEDFIMGLLHSCLQVALKEILDELIPPK